MMDEKFETENAGTTDDVTSENTTGPSDIDVRKAAVTNAADDSSTDDSSTDTSTDDAPQVDTTTDDSSTDDSSTDDTSTDDTSTDDSSTDTSTDETTDADAAYTETADDALPASDASAEHGGDTTLGEESASDAEDSAHPVETEAEQEPVSAEAFNDFIDEYRSPVEALIFASDEPITFKQLRDILFGETVQPPMPDGADAEGDHVSARPRSRRRGTPRFTMNALTSIVAALNKEYEEQGRVFRIVEVAGGFSFQTTSDFGIYVGRLFAERTRRRLTQSALETLAIIAFKQPISKPAIEAIRGVNADFVIKSLLERNLIAMVGRENSVGRPLLYGTTKVFLKHFGLHSLDDLPKPREIEDILAEDDGIVSASIEESTEDEIDHYQHLMKREDHIFDTARFELTEAGVRVLETDNSTHSGTEDWVERLSGLEAEAMQNETASGDRDGLETSALSEHEPSLDGNDVLADATVDGIDGNSDDDENENRVSDRDDEDSDDDTDDEDGDEDHEDSDEDDEDSDDDADDEDGDDDEEDDDDDEDDEDSDGDTDDEDDDDEDDGDDDEDDDDDDEDQDYDDSRREDNDEDTDDENDGDESRKKPNQA